MKRSTPFLIPGNRAAPHPRDSGDSWSIWSFPFTTCPLSHELIHNQCHLLGNFIIFHPGAYFHHIQIPHSSFPQKTCHHISSVMSKLPLEVALCGFLECFMMFHDGSPMHFPPFPYVTYVHYVHAMFSVCVPRVFGRLGILQAGEIPGSGPVSPCT